MRILPVRPLSKTVITLLTLASLGALLALSLSGCDTLTVNEEQSAKQTELRETELELNVQQTIRALKSDQSNAGTLEAQQATLNAQSLQASQQAAGLETTPEAPAPNEITQPVGQETVQSQDATRAAEAPSSTPAPPSDDELAERMESAKILLYEDMVNDTATNRYVKDTLDSMGLTYKDDGSAQGWLSSDMAAGGWDLVILATEFKKKSPGGEFYQYALEALEQGASVILETWYLDQSYTSSAAPLLSLCGVNFQADQEKIPPARQIFFPIAGDHPVLNEPNSGLSFTNSTSFWWDSNNVITYDTGDLVELAPGSDAQIVLGTDATKTSSHGTLTVCMDGRLTLQTFSSHSINFDDMKLAWENYIRNALKARFTSAP